MTLLSSSSCMYEGGDALTRRGNRCTLARIGVRCTNCFQTCQGYAACACCVLLIVVMTHRMSAVRAHCSSVLRTARKKSRNRLQKRTAHRMQPVRHIVRQTVRKPRLEHSNCSCEHRRRQTFFGKLTFIYKILPSTSRLEPSY